MSADTEAFQDRVVLVTGASRRVGAEIARTLHAAGARVLIHYRRSAGEAEALKDALNAVRPQSAATVAAALTEPGARSASSPPRSPSFGQLDILVNNASSFFPTPGRPASRRHSGTTSSAAISRRRCSCRRPPCRPCGRDGAASSTWWTSTACKPLQGTPGLQRRQGRTGHADPLAGTRAGTGDPRERHCARTCAVAGS